MKDISLLKVDGFDVEHMRSWLETLVHIKSFCYKLQYAIKDLEQNM